MMSSHTRKGLQAPANTVFPPTISANSNDRLKKAKEAIESLNGSGEAQERFREVWQKFRQAYEDTVNNNSKSNTYRPFPVWALSQFDPGYLERFLTAGYSPDLRNLRTCAPSASQHFKVDPWQFILYFDYIERARALALFEISVKRPGLTFNQLYEEVQKHRLKRIKQQKNPKYEFLPRDFKACLKESDNGDGSDAELYDEADQNQAEYAEGNNNNGNPENDHPDPVDNNFPNNHESDYTTRHDDHEDDLEELGELLKRPSLHSSHPRVSSLPIIIRDQADEIDGEDKVATPAASTPQAANVAIRRGMSREQSSSIDPFSDEGVFSNSEEQLFQEKRSIILDYERLKASVMAANKTTEVCIKKVRDENVAYFEKAKRLMSNPDAIYEDMQPTVDRLLYKMGNNNKKRKGWEDEHEQRKKFAANLETPEFQGHVKNASL